MCGIAGFSGNFDPSLLVAMSGLVAHRGPDDSGMLVVQGAGGRVGLAHRRLSIIDLSPDGHQPMGVSCPCCEAAGAADQDRLWISYNGEVYNFAEIRRDLEARGHRFRSKSDTEVLVHAYAAYGLGMLERLNGIFAFALYDGRPSGRPEGVGQGDLILARDGLGTKPLYVAELSAGLLFASELKAILACPDVPRDLDPQAVDFHMAYMWSPGPHTMLKAVRKLDPGAAMIVSAGRVRRTWHFYDLPYGREPMRGGEAEVARELAAEVEAAVRRQLVADVPVGAFLSGGLDSSAIVAMMRRANPTERIRCYSIGFAGDGTVEDNPADLPYAERVAKHLGVDLHPMYVEPEAICQLPRMLFCLDEPQADLAPLNALLISERARADGITVLMSGAGGDDILTGYRRHVALGAERHWSWLPGPIRAALAAPSRAVMSGAVGALGTNPLCRRVAKALAHADQPADERLAAYFEWNLDGLRRGLYGERLRTGLSGHDTLEPLLGSLSRIPGERDPLNRMLYLEGKHFLADHNLNYTDKVSMAAGVEVRVPLLDKELVDFATRIPTALKQKGSLGKAIFKRAMEPYLPHDVIYRPKSGFAVPLRRWLRHELRPLVEDVLSPASLRRRGLFDPAGVERLVRMNQDRRVDGAYTILALLCIELWCRMFIDPPTPRVVS